MLGYSIRVASGMRLFRDPAFSGFFDLAKNKKIPKKSRKKNPENPKSRGSGSGF